MARVNVAINITSDYRGGPGFRKASKDVEGFRKQVGRAANSVRAFQFVLAGVTISTAAIWGKRILEVADSMQLLRIRLSNVEGSLEAGNAKFKEIVETFKEVPFETEKIIDGFVRLRSAGISANVATETMNNLVDAVAAFGGTSAELQRATIGFQQVAGKGVLSMEELRQQIGEAIPGALAIMATAAGVSIAEFVAQVKKGAVTATDSLTFFNEGAKEAFGGFAENLRTTISGATAGLVNTLKQQIDRIFNVDTNLGARVVAFIRVITTRIEEFAASITQSDVDRFWNSFIGMAQVIEGVGRALAFIVEAIFKMAGAIGNAMGVVGGEALAFGIIGSMLGGPAFGVLVGTLVAISGGLDGITASINAMISPLQKAWEGWVRFTDRIYQFIGITQSDLASSDDLINRFLGLDALDRWLKDLDAFLGLTIETTKATKDLGKTVDEEASKVQKEISEMEFKGLKLSILSLSEGSLKVMEDIDNLSERVASAADNVVTPWKKSYDKWISDTKDARAKIEDEFVKLESGRAERQESVDSLAEGQRKEAQALLNKQYAETVELLNQQKDALAGVERNARSFLDTKNAEAVRKIANSYREIREEADQALGPRSLLREGQSEIAEKVRDWREELEKTNKVLKAVNSPESNAQLALNLKLLGDLDKVQAALNEKLKIQLGLEREKSRLAVETLRAQLNNETRELSRSITPDFRAPETAQAEQLRLEVQNKIRDTKQQILDLNIELLTADENRQLDIKEEIQLWEQYRENLISSQKEITDVAILNKKMWEDVASTIQNSMGSALADVITGTRSLKEAGLDLWRSLIRQAAEYIVKLLFIKALGGLGGNGMILGNAGIGTLFGAANGAAFKGKIQPFANGGLIKGPTMFGLAGEAGTEAIMPLKRVNGRLGVSADGAPGGDTFQININAIDTQTGAQFLLDNMSTIVQGVQHENSLNRGIRRSV